ncbi:MAG: hypothetical protein COT14_01865 [Candidatus Diapherotrites archaeon CG08_land_8_20_14_0_20_30_16]|nr:MAG: hypothetical protein COT14_01865 [Candidatus Diapherotrites archaeon CG08_land_8_20_14_0_20_30_16]
MQSEQYWRVFKKSLKASFLTALEYRADFYSSIIIQIIYFIIQFLFFSIIFSHITILKGWGLGDLLFLIFLNDVGLTLFEVTGIRGMYYLVITGQLNTKLVKPKDTFFLIALEELSINSIFFAICDIILLFFVATYFSLSMSFLPFIVGLILYVISLPLLVLPIMFIETLSFFWGETEGLLGIYHSMIFSIKEYPLSIFNKFFIILFSILSPGILLHLFLPAAIILGKIDPVWGLWGILASIAFDIIGIYLFYKFFKYGLKKYEGYG